MVHAVQDAADVARYTSTGTTAVESDVGSVQASELTTRNSHSQLAASQRWKYIL